MYCDPLPELDYRCMLWKKNFALNLMFQIFNPRLLSGIGCYSLWESWNAFVESKVESATSLLHPFSTSLYSSLSSSHASSICIRRSLVDICPILNCARPSHLSWQVCCSSCRVKTILSSPQAMCWVSLLPGGSLTNLVEVVMNFWPTS